MRLHLCSAEHALHDADGNILAQNLLLNTSNTRRHPRPHFGPLGTFAVSPGRCAQPLYAHHGTLGVTECAWVSKKHLSARHGQWRAPEEPVRSGNILEDLTSEALLRYALRNGSRNLQLVSIELWHVAGVQTGAVHGAEPWTVEDDQISTCMDISLLVARDCTTDYMGIATSYESLTSLSDTGCVLQKE